MADAIEVLKAQGAILVDPADIPSVVDEVVAIGAKTLTPSLDLVGKI